MLMIHVGDRQVWCCTYLCNPCAGASFRVGWAKFLLEEGDEGFETAIAVRCRLALLPATNDNLFQTTASPPLSDVRLRV